MFKMIFLLVVILHADDCKINYLEPAQRYVSKSNDAKSEELKKRYYDISEEYNKMYLECINSNQQQKVYKPFRSNSQSAGYKDLY